MAFITDEMAEAMARHLEQRCAEDPVYAEDVASLMESKDYLVSTEGRSAPVRCECCGVLVWRVQEMATGPVRRWMPAVWECEAGRKHTLRRCTWLRENGAPRVATPLRWLSARAVHLG